ncbi:hypothetical protein [Chryseobacterium candidae]|jgi:hypothetical protein|uniref:Uncharacterized protein n=1 Tax=Chryseobacterium candidae TaxID=1978493 RepID=A0ABY2R4M5_9FLAO|nr:hypothetical protein [Chryseobacterium candidae]THV56652.1 hypothetical protein EK417_18225 [Chryseobacterium candidae]
MKKIIFALLLTTSAMLFARTEEPKVKIEESKSKVETVLVAKKNFKDEKAAIKMNKELKQAMNLEGCLAIAFTITPVDPSGGAAMIGYCLETYSR